MILSILSNIILYVYRIVWYIGKICLNKYGIETGNAVKMTTLFLYWLFCHGALKLDLALFFAKYFSLNIRSIDIMSNFNNK